MKPLKKQKKAPHSDGPKESNSHTRMSKPNVVQHLKTSPHRKKKRSQLLFAVVILAVLVFLASIIAYFTLGNDAAPSPTTIQQNKIDAIQALGATDTTLLPNLTTIQSSLGFSLTVDTKQFDVSGQTTDPSSTNTFVSGQEYQKEELEATRPYSIIKVRIPSSDPEVVSYDNAELVMLTNIRKDYWSTRQLPDERKIDTLLRLNAENYKSSDGWAASSPKDQAINGVNFKEVTYTNTRSYGDLQFTTKYVVYITVQNDRPYFATIYNVQGNSDQVAMLQAVLNTAAFTTPDESKLANTDSNPSDNVLGESTDDILEKTANTPYSIDEDTVFDVILKNQPSVVRVATFRCADVLLKSFTGEVLTTLKDACNGIIGSGSIVSEDGYVATNGHVVAVNDSSVLQGYLTTSETSQIFTERVNQVLDYLVLAGLARDEDIDRLFQDHDNGFLTDQNLIDAIFGAIPDSLMTLENDASSHYLQLGITPMRTTYASNRLAIETNETVVPAQFIAMDFSTLSENQTYAFGSDDASDVALLKTEGSFPAVEIGSVQNLEPGTTLTAIGFPWFVDRGLSTTKSSTPPTITQGKVISVSTESYSKQNILITTDVPIAQGNSGGPAFDQAGRQVGLNTYSQIECADAECFGDGIARDVADFLDLTREQNIALQTASSLSERWQSALGSYLDGNYKDAVKKFDSLDDEYPAFYLATRLQTLSDAKIGTPSDVSSEYEANSNYAVVAISAFILMVVAGGSLVGYLLYGSHQHHLQSMQPTPQPANYPVATPANVTPVPVPPIQSNQAPAPTPRAQQVINNQTAIPAAAPQTPNTPSIIQPVQQLPPTQAPQPTTPPQQPDINSSATPSPPQDQGTT